mmetsp:Transcript_22661/g.37215  ORF Transcript_22661/g.37215 Transcript_22661/m.37215 type:complete len:315 (-) Transcript_22661:2405-3349(-)
MHFAAQKFGQLGPAGLAHRLDGLALVAQYDTFVAVAHDIDDLVNPGRTIFALFPSLRLDGELVRQFLMQAQGQFFAGHFGGNHAHGQVRDLVFGVEPRPLGHLRGKPVAQRIDTMAFLGRDHESFCKIIAFVEILGQAQQRSGLNPVDLVDGQCHSAALADFGQTFEDAFHPFGHTAMRLDHQHNHICVRRPAPGGRDHGAVQTAAGLEQARRVHEHDLAVALHRHAPNAGAGCLHLVGHDRNLRPDHAVQQGGFARIGLSDKGDKSGAGAHVSCSNWASRALAAACCASRFDPAVARAVAPVLSSADMVKTGA